MTGPDISGVALAALDRVAVLLSLLDREHTHDELYTNLRGVRHELVTAQEALRRPVPASGSSSATEAPRGLEPPSWAARRALSTRPDGHRHRALRELVRAPTGMTDPELAERLAVPVKVAKQLRWEMVAASWVMVTRQKRVNPVTGRACSVWLGSASGRAMLGKLESGQLKLELDTPED